MTKQSANALYEFIDIILFFSLQSKHLNAFCMPRKGDMHSAEGQSQANSFSLSSQSAKSNLTVQCVEFNSLGR